MIPLLIGIFGFAEVLTLSMKIIKDVEVVQEIGKVYPTWKELKPLLPTITRSSILGTIVGAIPAAGGTISAIMAYGVENGFPNIRRNSEQVFRKVLLHPEAANNATTGGAMIPLLTLGIPGDASTGNSDWCIADSRTDTGTEPVQREYAGGIFYLYFAGAFKYRTFCLPEESEPE